MAEIKRKRAPGGGRKPLAPDDPTERHDVTMLASYWEQARALGDGNASAGIRLALEQAQNSTHPTTDSTTDSAP